VPEVVDHGLTGFIVDDEKEELQAIKRLPELDPSRVLFPCSHRLRHSAPHRGAQMWTFWIVL